MSNESDIFEKPSVERLVTGGLYVLIFGLLAAVLGWAFVAVASQDPPLGVGPDLLFYTTSGMAFHVIAICISTGFHQALSKYLSEALVESKEKALKYAKAGFLIFNIIGIIFFTIFITIAAVILPYNLGLGLLFATLAVAYFLTFLKDNFIGNLAAEHRFDYIGKIILIAGITGTIISFGILFLLPEPINAYLLPLPITFNLTISIIFALHYGKKVMPYSFSSIFRGARRNELIQVVKYGLFCTVPSIIFSGAIMWIQNFYYIGFFSISNPYIPAMNGLIIGYAGVVFAICQFGWPQIPAISEAKAMGDTKLIDDYMKNTLHTGFNLTAFFLIFYFGMSNILLQLFHGSKYLIAHWPFSILSVSVAILGIEFLICTLLMGLGKGKQAAYLIISLAVIQLVLVPLLIIILQSAFGVDATLFAGPCCLLISGLAIFPFAYRYMARNTNTPTKVYRDILWKGIVSVTLTLVFHAIIDMTLLTLLDNLIIALVVRTSILIGLFILFMLIFAGFDDKDLGMYKFMGPVAGGMRWLLHHSPFYEKEEDEDEVAEINNERLP
ncbi:MAG: hypothetical protein HWN65_00495 [Candidatus Helarchaeota archaeon]|nr:hypothetical protein [Candidatus Helarchaeota archaeon]